MPSTEIVPHKSSPIATPPKASPVFERITKIEPAFDCIVNQPCRVSATNPCRPEPSGSNHGRCDAWMSFTLRSAIADLTVVVMTGWHIPETPPDKRMPVVLDRIGLPRAAYVDFHSLLPAHNGQSPLDTDGDCTRWPGRACYADRGYTMADDVTDLLVRKGSDAVWTWLEKLHADTFKGR